MFIETMTPFAQSVTLSLGAQVVAADGKITSEEVALLEKLKRHCDEEVETTPIKISELPSIAEKLTRREKVGMLMELTALAFADHDFHESESTALEDISIALGIDEEFEDVVGWVKRQLMLIKEAEILMED